MAYLVFLDGRIIDLPSVTTICAIETRYWITKWRNKVGADKADQISAEASGRGHTVHKLSAQYLSGIPINTEVWNSITTQEQNSLCALDRWVKRAEYKPLLIEETVISVNDLYGGRIDTAGIAYSKPSLIDFKTGKISRSNGTQLSAYDHALVEMDLYHAEQGIVVWLDPKNGIPKEVIIGADELRDEFIKRFFQLKVQYDNENLGG